MGWRGSRWGGEGLDGVVSIKLQDILKVQKCREGGEGLDGVVRVLMEH